MPETKRSTVHLYCILAPQDSLPYECTVLRLSCCQLVASRMHYRGSNDRDKGYHLS